ncbi:MAG TPA: hypothetical protein DCY94_03080, partial [Firmicutes bacterium]|nr:hypothetical protein [Bacillota bacterium]
MLEIYSLFSFSCFIADNLMELYTRERLLKEGYKFKKSKMPVFRAVIETLASLILSFVPGLNFKRVLQIIFKREEEYQRLKKGQIALGLVYKDPEIKNSEASQDFGEIPPELKDVLEK